MFVKITGSQWDNLQSDLVSIWFPLKSCITLQYSQSFSLVYHDSFTKTHVQSDISSIFVPGGDIKLRGEGNQNNLVILLFFPNFKIIDINDNTIMLTGGAKSDHAASFFKCEGNQNNSNKYVCKIRNVLHERIYERGHYWVTPELDPIRLNIIRLETNLIRSGVM